MRIHTDKLSANDLRAALPDGVHAYITPKGSRKRARAFEITLFVIQRDELHMRLGNSGGYGASSDLAATWDEWGIWMARLYELDSRVLIGWYESHDHFVAMTTRQRDYVRMVAKPHHIKYRTHLAPWLAPDFDAERRAEAAGYEAGKAAGSWVIDGNTAEGTARAYLAGIEEGDPEVLDTLPSSPLSGEYADGLLPRDVLAMFGLDEDAPNADDILNAYEAGYSSGVVDEVARSARAILPEVVPA